jgi:hypothetical protein
MVRLKMLAAFAILLGAFLVGTGRSGEKGGAPPKKVYLPKYWSRLGLSAEQKKKMLKTRADYQAKIQALKDQITTLTREEQQALRSQLTEAQKEQLRKIITEKLGGEPPPEKKKGADKKASKEG